MPVNSLSDQEFLNHLNETVHANIENEEFGVSELAREMGTSRSNLHRKIHKIFKISASRFIRQERLNHAKELLKNSSCNVSEAAYKSGFNNTSYFIKCFQEQYGFSPGKFREREKKQAITARENNFKKRRKKYLVPLIAFTLFFIVGLTFLKIFNATPCELKKEKGLKSIALLPFKYEGQDPGNAHYVSGTMVSVLDKLAGMDRLDVRSLLSVQKYEGTEKHPRKIAKELNVRYLVNAVGQVYGNSISITIQLIDACSDQILLSKTFSTEINEVRDIINLQSNIALTVANEIDAELTAKEKKETAELPTDNLAAYNYYQKALSHLDIAKFTTTSTIANKTKHLQEVLKAKLFLEKAVKLDSTFARAYVLLGQIYMNELSLATGNTELKFLYRDSGLLMANKAISYDDNIRWAWSLKSHYYDRKGMVEKAEELRKTAETKSPFSYSDREGSGAIYTNAEKGYFYEAVKQFYLFLDDKPEDELIRPALLHQFCECLVYTGFHDVAKKYYKKTLEISDDSVQYYTRMGWNELWAKNYQSAIEYGEKSLQIDSVNYSTLLLLNVSSILPGNYKAALKYTIQKEKASHLTGIEMNFWSDGFVYQMNGNKNKAENHYRKSIETHTKEMEYNLSFARIYYAHFILACIYSNMGEKQKAFDYLNEVSNRRTIPLWIMVFMEDWPMLDNIRGEPEFEAIFDDFRTKYRKEHKRIEKLLRERGELPSAVVAENF